MTGKNKNGLLSKKERRIFRIIAAEDSLNSQRAQAILAVAGNASPADASKRSGLRTDQVEFWLERFRVKGMLIFPRALVARSKKSAKIAKAKSKDKKQNKKKNRKSKKTGELKKSTKKNKSEMEKKKKK